MNLENAILSEVSQRRRDIIGHPLCKESKRNHANELIYKTERDSQTQKMNLWLPGGRDS